MSGDLARACLQVPYAKNVGSSKEAPGFSKNVLRSALEILF